MFFRYWGNGIGGLRMSLKKNPSKGREINLSFLGSSLPAGLSYSRTGVSTDVISGVLTQFEADSPRISAANGILIEEQRTNLSFNSSLAASSGGSISGSQEDPLRGNSAVLFTEDTSTNSHLVISNSVTPSASSVYSTSVFVKPGTATKVQLCTSSNFAALDVYANFDLTGAGSVTFQDVGVRRPFIQQLNNGWYRIGFSFVTSGTPGSGTTLAICSIKVGTEGRLANTLGTGATFYTFGPQFELGFQVLSYIPTTTVNATRGADLYTLSDLTFLSNSDHTFFLEAVCNPLGYDTSLSINTRVLDINTLNSANNIYVSKRFSDGKISGNVISQGVGQVGSMVGSNWAIGAVAKMVFSWNFVNAHVRSKTTANAEASTITPIGSNGPPGISDIVLGRRGVNSPNGGWLNGYIRRLEYKPKRISGAEASAMVQ